MNLLVLATILVSLAAVGSVLYAIRLKTAESEIRMGTEHDFVGRLAPAAQLSDLDNEKATTLIEQRGKLVLLILWGTWDTSSRQFAPLWNRIWERHREHPKFAMVTVACESPTESVGADPDSFAEATRRFMQEQGLTFPVWRDPEALARSLFYMDQGEYPLTVLIGPDGSLRAVWYGPVPGMQEELPRLVDRYLSEFGDS